MSPDLTAPKGAVWSGFKLLVIEATKADERAVSWMAVKEQMKVYQPC